MHGMNNRIRTPREEGRDQLKTSLKGEALFLVMDQRTPGTAWLGLRSGGTSKLGLSSACSSGGAWCATRQCEKWLWVRRHGDPGRDCLALRHQRPEIEGEEVTPPPAVCPSAEQRDGSAAPHRRVVHTLCCRRTTSAQQQGSSTTKPFNQHLEKTREL